MSSLEKQVLWSKMKITHNFSVKNQLTAHKVKIDWISSSSSSSSSSLFTLLSHRKKERENTRKQSILYKWHV